LPEVVTTPFRPASGPAVSAAWRRTSGDTDGGRLRYVYDMCWPR